jgi:Uma2 family endonuclease
MEAVTVGSSALKAERLFTYADYQEWELDEGERYELIDGVACAMSAPNAVHQEIVAILTAKFYNFLEGKPCKVYPAPYDVRLFYEEDESDDTVVQPDLSVICAEIVSPPNTFVEMARKFDLYRKAGVREYWLVTPEAQALLVYGFEGKEIITRSYGPAETARSGIFPGLEIPLKTVFPEQP